MIDGAQITAAIRSAFAEPLHGVGYALTRNLAALFPGRFVLETADHEFAIERYANAGHCRMVAIDGATPMTQHAWHDRIYVGSLVGAWSIEWPEAPGEPLIGILVAWGEAHCQKHVQFVVASSRDLAERLFTAVCTWHCDLAGSVLVFDGGSWHKSRELYADIARTRAADLILPAAQRDEILGDLQRFIDRKAEYDRLSVPWKRGVLLNGPPGNGKTMCIKMLANSLRVPVAGGGSKAIDPLYVRSLVSPHVPDHYTIGQVFERARRHTPCLLIFEDLDSLVTAKNRSVFLNELDGLAVNSGIITIASTNHAERLDPALKNRPSRFDRTWHFAQPEFDERQRFLANWSERADAGARLDAAAHARVAELTDGFSFAYLKELMISSLMRWIDAGPVHAPLVEVVARQISLLREQMSETVELPSLPAVEANDRYDDDDRGDYYDQV